MSKLFGSIRELVRVVFRQNSQEITLDSNSGTTYTADRTVELPPIDANETIVGQAATQPLTNKTIDADLNTISNLAHGSEVDSPSSGVHGVTGSVVGTTDTQTLTNKEIDAPTITSYEAMPAVTEGSVPTPSAGTFNRFHDTADSTYKYKDSNGDVFPFGGSGSGSGEINYIENPSAEVNTGGWSLYLDAAASEPVDGTGGSSTALFVISDTGEAPLRGDNSFRYIKSAGDKQGEGVSYDFAIDKADRNSLLKISMDYVNQAGAFYATGDLGVFIYDVDNAQLITVSNNDLFAGKGLAELQFVSTDSLNYRFIIHTRTTNASQYTLFFDNVIVGPGSTTIAQGAVVTEWQPFTLSLNNFTNDGSEEAYYRRVGDSAEIRFTTNHSGAGAGGTVQFNLDTNLGLTINEDAEPTTSSSTSGNGWANLSGTRTDLVIASDSTNNNILFYQSSTNDNIDGPDFSAGNTLSATFTVPILEWAATGTVILPTTDDLSISAWQDFTPTGTWTTNTTYSGKYRRVGDSIDLQYHIDLSGAPDATALFVDMPSGLTINESALADTNDDQVDGQVVIRDVPGTARFGVVRLTSASDQFRLTYLTDTGTEETATSITNTAPFTLASGDRITVHIRGIPVEQWADLGKVPAVGIQEATADVPGLLTRYEDSGEGDLPSLTWGGTPPTSLQNAKYRWIKIANQVTIHWKIEYGSAGSGNATVFFTLPSDIPSPTEFSIDAASEVLAYHGSGTLSAASSSIGEVASTMFFRSGSDYRLYILAFQTTNATQARGSITYITDE